MIRVVHWKKEPFDIYIGRTTKQFHFGNPFSHLPSSIAMVKVGSREEAIEAFGQWLKGENYKELEQERRQWILDNLHTLKDKILGCWCAPQDCHGRILKEMVENA